MIYLKFVNVEEQPEFCFKYSKSDLKYEKINDRKLSFASNFLKKNKEENFFSISHSYPYCFIAESNEPVGLDIENIKNEQKNYKEIVKRFFNKEEQKINNYYEFLTLWIIKESYFKLTQDKKYLSASLEKIKNQNNCCFAAGKFFSNIVFCVTCFKDNSTQKIITKKIDLQRLD